MVTWIGLAKLFLLLIGLAMVLGGGLEAYAGAMSDAPGKGEQAGRTGCSVVMAGLVIVVIAITLMVL